jgi:hypothetical protein
MPLALAIAAPVERAKRLGQLHAKASLQGVESVAGHARRELGIVLGAVRRQLTIQANDATSDH